MVEENRDYPKGDGKTPRTLEPQGDDGERRFSPSVSRNRAILREAFLDNVPADAAVLEIGSGTGEHGIFITESEPDMSWTFSEFSQDAANGIQAWIDHANRAGLHGPFLLDASSAEWGEGIEGQPFDVMFSANVVHISPISVLQGIMAGAGRLLSRGGRLVFYGPFARDGFMVESNQAFDADLKRRNVEWGVRDLERDLLPLASGASLKLVITAEMPKNNLFLVFERR